MYRDFVICEEEVCSAASYRKEETTVSGTFETGHQLSSLVDQFMATRNISQRQYRRLSQLVLADGSIDEQELREINRLFDAIQTGRIRVID